MKKWTPLIISALTFLIHSAAFGEVYTTVYLADGNTPLEFADPNIPFVYREIMVGTKLTIVVSSDTDGYWGGDLAITGQDRDYGFLSARDYNETTHDWAGSRLPAAGDRARIWAWEEPGVQGFSFQGHKRAVAGDWFIIDYTAMSIGACSAGFYDRNVSWVEPAYRLTFFHVPTRDFNNDTAVNFRDFALFTSCWQLADYTYPNLCAKTDLDIDGDVDSNDLALFTDYWLERTE